MKVNLSKKQLQVIRATVTMSGGYIDKDFLPKSISPQEAYNICMQIMDMTQTILLPALPEP